MSLARHSAPWAYTAVAVAIVVLVVLGFGPLFPSKVLIRHSSTVTSDVSGVYTTWTSTTLFGSIVRSSTYFFTETQTVQVPVSSITSTVITESSLATLVTQPFSLRSQTLQPNSYAAVSSQIRAYTDIKITFNASSAVDVYLFNSQQFAAYGQSGNTASQVSMTGQSSGTLGFFVPLSDKYTLVVYNPNVGFLGIGAHSVDINSVLSTASYQETVTGLITQTGTSVSLRNQTITTTLSSVGSSTLTTSTVASEPITSTFVSSSTVTVTNTSTTTTSKGLFGF